MAGGQPRRDPANPAGSPPRERAGTGWDWSSGMIPAFYRAADRARILKRRRVIHIDDTGFRTLGSPGRCVDFDLARANNYHRPAGMVPQMIQGPTAPADPQPAQGLACPGNPFAQSASLWREE